MTVCNLYGVDLFMCTFWLKTYIYNRFVWGFGNEGCEEALTRPINKDGVF